MSTVSRLLPKLNQETLDKHCKKNEATILWVCHSQFITVGDSIVI